MPLDSLYLDNFRLFSKTKIHFKNNHTIILGKNGSGKTTIVEAINLLYSNKSLRSKDIKDCIKEGSDFFKVSAKGTLENKEFTKITRKKLDARLESKIEPREIKRADLERPVVVLNKQLKLIDGDPEIRRELFYQLMFHVKPDLKNLHKKYTQVLSQRNKALKQGAQNKEIIIWTNKLLDLGIQLAKGQLQVFNSFKKSVAKEVIPKRSLDFYKGLNLRFKKGWASSKELEEVLSESLDKERALGYTLNGPHKFDFVFNIHQKNTKEILSRGQQKLLILLTFLSINDFFIAEKKPSSILIIDDLTSELDEENLKVFLDEVPKQDNQIIMTDIDPNDVLKKDKKLNSLEKIIL